jgi:hypothetical protein
MRIICLLVTGILIAFTCHAQREHDSLAKHDLVGVWQENTNRVENGLNQNFRFYRDGTFALNFDNGGDDMRVILALKGRYRLVGNQLFMEIVYRTVTDSGHVEISGSSEDFYNFALAGKIKDIREPIIKELLDPLTITIHGPGHIDIGNEAYFKISKAEMPSIEPGPPDSTALPVLNYERMEALTKRIHEQVRKIDER